MHGCSSGDAPIIKGDKLSKSNCIKNELDKESLKQIAYASTIGSLMYAQVCTNLTPLYSIGVLGRFQSNPGIGSLEDS